MSDLQPITRPFPNGGLQLKQDPALLDQAHYSELTNMVSVQEGNLAVRPGNQKLTDAGTFAGATAIHSIAEMHIGSQGAETRYVGEGGNIWANPTGEGSVWIKAATDCAPTPAVPPGAYPRQSFSAESYSAGASGTPYEYFACPSRMLKDNGHFTVLQNWGIARPSQPAITGLGTSIAVGTDTDVVVTPGGGSLDNIATVQVASFTGTAPGNITITPNNLTWFYQIKVGMLLHIGTAPAAVQIAPVLRMTATSFTLFLSAAPVVGANIQAAVLVNFNTGTDVIIPIAPVAWDASYNGKAANGYSTDDLVRFGLNFSDVKQYKAVSFRVLVGGSTTDYYEIVIIDPANWAGSVATYGLGSVTRELAIPKSAFTAVGNAGTPQFSWKVVTGFQLVFTKPTGAAQIDLDSVYFSGGVGPNVGGGGVTSPYKYVYTFRNPITGAEGNPSVEQIQESAVSPASQTVSVACLGTTDPQITGPSSIAVYRSGGAFADNIYRLVGYAENPGTATLVTFSDHQSDFSILVANTADFDNDQPVTSSLPTPLIMSSATAAVAGVMSTVVVSVTSGNLASLRVGSNATVGLNSDSKETVVIAAMDLVASTVTFFSQSPHPDLGETTYAIEVNEVAGQPANLCLAAFDSLFVAGDPNNPHVLYKSKTGRPEAFPIIEFATGIANAINVGTPSNRIVALTEYNSGVLCLNAENLYYVRVNSGVMEIPIATPAQRGLIAKNAWCRADNEIWYLAYDGVYSWSGGISQLRSLDIDPLFNRINVPPYAAIDLRPGLGSAGADMVSMEYSDNQIFISYVDVAGKPFRLRYHTIFNRWAVEVHQDAASGSVPCMITAQRGDRITGELYIAKNPGGVAYFYSDNLGATDGWVIVEAGSDISYAFVPAAFTLQAPNMNKTFADVTLEYSALSSLALDCFYDYADTTSHAAAGDTFTIPVSRNRTRLPLSLQNGFHREAYAMQTRFYGNSNIATAFYSMTANLVPLTQIQVGRAYDWDDLGWPYDKRLYQLVMEYDISVGHSVTMNMDIMTGVIGVQQETSAVQTFVLTPPTSVGGTPNRITANFALKDNMIVKKVRLRPTVVNVPFKHFSYSFPEFTKYPADTTLFTEWNDLGYPGEKVFRTLNLEMNSSGLPCVVQLQGDHGNLGNPITVTTTLNDRARILTLQSDLISQNTRLVLTPSEGGYSQYFKHSFDHWREPMAVTHFDSYEFNFKYNGWNFVKQAWLEYTCPVPLLLTYFVDNGQRFYAVNLPAHPQRDVERFYLPDSQLTVINEKLATILNKSKRKRFTVDSSDTRYPFKIYADGSRLEWMPCGADQRSVYQQDVLTEVMSPQIGVGQ